MKVINSHHINPFGGLNFVFNTFDKLNLEEIMEKNLPPLAAQSKYKWKDILYSFWAVYFCGGDCIEDLSGNLRSHIGTNPFAKTPSPDRVLDRFKELSVPKALFSVPRGKSLHQFSLHHSLNELNLKILGNLGLKGNDGHTLDYDNTILFTEKCDAMRTYKKDFGYCPGVGLIGSNVVYVENRNGNSDAQTLQFETLNRMFSALEEQNITIRSFRADGASYQFDIIDFVSRKVEFFYLRAVMSDALAQQIASIEDWEKIELGNETAYRSETVFTPFVRTAKRRKTLHRLKEYRLVVTKVKRNDNQVNMFTNEAFNYSAILTNDLEKSKDGIVHFYNQRGVAEKEFDILKNDFGWKNLPFSKLEQNQVFLVFTAICRNLYGYIINSFSERFRDLRPTFRIKKFIFRFIAIPAKWIRSSRQNKLKLYGKLHYNT
tara:strand:+ start:109 stop:1404 length:1296 start_codon:yes stop_codon:yes gene_type:complete